MRFPTTALVAALSALAFSGPAIAAGSGGGGASSMPSQSAPEYDPAQEYAKAIAALKAKQYKDASRAATRVTSAVPKSVDAWKVLGAAKSGELDWKGAKRAYERAVKLAPEDATIHAGLGIALANLKDPKVQAEIDWLKAKALACGGACPEAATLTALVGAVESATATPAAAPAPVAALPGGSLLFAGAAAGDAAYVAAVGLINEKRYDEALVELANGLTVFGPHPDLITYQGYAWRRKGDLARAEAYYRQALAIAPDHRGATEYYGELKVEQGDLKGARAMLARLDAACAFGCAEAEELRRWIDIGRAPSS